jgi:hypothetical protein
VLHYNRERCAVGRRIDCILREFHITDLAVKIDDNRVLWWASCENARNNLGNTELAELGLAVWKRH